MVGKRYRILETLGKGAFGTVYRAEVMGAGDFKKQVALKVLDYKGDAPEEIALRFRDEARILGLIRHRAVVGVDSLAELETGWAVVMEYVDGVNVSVVVKYGLPPARVCVEIIEEVASALHAAWNTVSDESGEALRLVHRDIKPANIRLTAQGQVKVLDFGVARAEFESREAHTQAMRFGSLRYMAPESFDGIEGHPTDIFALGIVFAELLAGQRLEEPPKNPDRYGAFLEKVRDAASARLSPTMKAKQFKAVLNLVCKMIAFEPDDRPDARTVERAARELSSRLDGATLRDWSEDYVPALAEKLARRKAQKEAQDPTLGAATSSILAEKSASHTLDGGLPDDAPLEESDTPTSRSQTAAVFVSSGVTVVVMLLVLLVMFGGGYLAMSGDGASGSAEDPAALAEDAPEMPADGPGEADDAPQADAPDDTPMASDIGGGTSEFVEFADPEDASRTIVIARSALQVEGQEIRVTDPADTKRTIVIARSAVAASEGDGTEAPDAGERVVTVTKTDPQPTQAVVPSPTPAPAPAPAPTVSGGTVQVTGDASSVSFVGSSGSSFGAGTIPAGTYRIMAVFPGQTDPIQAGNLTVRDGGTTTVNCSGLMLRCSSK